MFKLLNSNFADFRFEMKHAKQLGEARAGSQATVKELEQLQNEKRKMLMEHETSKLKELDEGYAKEFKDWKADLKPRKQVGEPLLTKPAIPLLGICLLTSLSFHLKLNLFSLSYIRNFLCHSL